MYESVIQNSDLVDRIRTCQSQFAWKTLFESFCLLSDYVRDEEVLPISEWLRAIFDLDDTSSLDDIVLFKKQSLAVILFKLSRKKRPELLERALSLLNSISSKESENLKFKIVN